MKVTSVRVETIATILLSLAALCTAWAGYQATLWSGEQGERSAEAGGLRAKATRSSTASGQMLLIDVGLFNSWLEERTRGDVALARFIEGRFRPEFKAAFAAWLETNPLSNPAAAPSPFSLPAYHLKMADSAAMYDKAADSVSEVSRAANRTSDSYVLAAVILATVMFFSTTAQQTNQIVLRWMLLSIAMVACLGGLVRLVTLPRG